MWVFFSISNYNNFGMLMQGTTKLSKHSTFWWQAEVTTVKFTIPSLVNSSCAVSTSGITYCTSKDSCPLSIHPGLYVLDYSPFYPSWPNFVLWLLHDHILYMTYHATIAVFNHFKWRYLSVAFVAFLIYCIQNSIAVLHVDFLEHVYHVLCWLHI